MMSRMERQMSPLGMQLQRNIMSFICSTLFKIFSDHHYANKSVGKDKQKRGKENSK